MHKAGEEQSRVGRQGQSEAVKETSDTSLKQMRWLCGLAPHAAEYSSL